MERSPDGDRADAAVLAAIPALQGLIDSLARRSSTELATILGVVDRLGQMADAARVAVTVEAVGRGDVDATGLRTDAWVRGHAPSTCQGSARSIAAMAERIADRAAGLASVRTIASLTSDEESASADAAIDDDPVVVVGRSVLRGEASVDVGLTALTEVARMRDLLVPGTVSTVTRTLVDLGCREGVAPMRRLRPAMLARYGHHGQFDDLQDRLAASAFLSVRFVASADVTEYRMALTPGQAAVLEAAIGPLSVPQPNDEAGERDHRPAGQRRAEALIAVCARAVAADSDQRGGIDGSAAALLVTMDLADLQADRGAGEVLGSLATGTLLGPAEVRRHACDAGIIPVVLGSDGAVLDLGRAVRLFTRSQRHALALRDRCCTYPGCSAPGSTVRAHHIQHWVDGGASDLANAALLCQRHHTVVHQRRLWAIVREHPDEHGRRVEWDLAAGSYDRALTRSRTDAA